MYFIFSCQNKTDEAIKYNDNIIIQQQKIVQLFNRLDSSFADTIHQSFIENHKLLSREINRQFHFIDSLPSFNNDSSFKSEYKKLLTIYRDVVQNNYTKMIELYTLPDSLYTQSIKDEFLNIYKQSNEQLQNAINEFIKFQQSFAKKYNFSLQE